MRGKKVKVGCNPEIKWEESIIENRKKGIWEIRNSDKFPSLLQKMHKAEVHGKIRPKNEIFILEKNIVLIKSGKNHKEKSYIDSEHKFIRIK